MYLKCLSVQITDVIEIHNPHPSRIWPW